MLHAHVVCVFWSTAPRPCHRQSSSAALGAPGVSRLPRPQARRLVTGPLCSHQALGAMHGSLPTPAPPHPGQENQQDALEATKDFGAWRIGVGGLGPGVLHQDLLWPYAVPHAPTLPCPCTAPSSLCSSFRVYRVEMASGHHDSGITPRPAQSMAPSPAGVPGGAPCLLLAFLGPLGSFSSHGGQHGARLAGLLQAAAWLLPISWGSQAGLA